MRRRSCKRRGSQPHCSSEPGRAKCRNRYQQQVALFCGSGLFHLCTWVRRAFRPLCLCGAVCTHTWRGEGGQKGKQCMAMQRVAGKGIRPPKVVAGPRSMVFTLHHRLLRHQEGRYMGGDTPRWGRMAVFPLCFTHFAIGAFFGKGLTLAPPRARTSRWMCVFLTALCLLWVMLSLLAAVCVRPLRATVSFEESAWTNLTFSARPALRIAEISRPKQNARHVSVIPLNLTPVSAVERVCRRKEF